MIKNKLQAISPDSKAVEDPRKNRDCKSRRSQGEVATPTKASGLRDEGFTLIELVVLMGVITIISGIIFLNFREGESNLLMQRSAQEVTQVFATALNNSLAGKYHANTVSPGGFGVILKQNRQDLIIFADCNGDNFFDEFGGASSCDTATGPSPYPETFFTTTLKKDIIVSTLSPCSGSPCRLIVTFSPPDPQVTFVPALFGSEAQITLRDSRGRTLDIFINKLGVMRIVQ